MAVVALCSAGRPADQLIQLAVDIADRAPGGSIDWNKGQGNRRYDNATQDKEAEHHALDDDSTSSQRRAITAVYTFNYTLEF